MRTVTGEWRESLFYDGVREVASIQYGDLTSTSAPLCRIHSYCMSSHVLLSAECDCVEQMLMAQQLIVKNGAGIIVVLMQDGRGFGHQAFMAVAEYSRSRGIPQSKAYADLLGDSDARNYRSAIGVLRYFGIRAVDLLTNNPQKVQSLVDGGISVEKTTQLRVEDLTDRPELRQSYLDKRNMGHEV